MIGARRERWRRHRTPVLLALLAFLLYFPGFWWGAPHATGPELIHGWAVDDETPLGPLAQVNNILHPQEVQNLGYPLMHSFMVTAAYAPYLGWLKVSGQWDGPSGGEYPYGFRDPVGVLQGLTRIGHFLSVLLGVVVVLGAWATARAVWDERTGVLAALVTLTSYPMFYYSRTGNVDVPMMAFLAIALAAYARALRAPPTPRLAVILGVAAGCAMATKEQAGGLLIAMAPVFLAIHALACRANGRGGWDAWKVPMLALGSVVMAFGLGSGLFVDPTRFFAHLAHGGERMELARSGVLWFIPTFPRTWDGNLDLARLLGGFAAQVLTLPGLLLGGVGVILAARQDRRTLLLALPALSYLALLYFATRTGQLRYLMPPAFVIGLFTARALALGIGSSHRGWRVATAAVATVVMGLGLLRGLDLTWAMLHDSRYAAAEWIAAQATPGDRIEYFGSAYKLPALPGDTELALATPNLGPLKPPLRDAAAAATITAGWRERRPEFILVSPDWSSFEGEPFPAACPPEVFAALSDGSAGYRLAAVFETPALLPWVRRPPLDYPMVNIALRVFIPESVAVQ